MKTTALATLLLSSGLLAACGARVDHGEDEFQPAPSPSPTSPAPGSTTPAPASPPSGGSGGTGDAKAAVTAEGSVSVESGGTQYDLSLAILPRTFSKGGLYEYEGSNYPTTTAAREAVVDSVAYTYPQLAKECAALHPEIVLPKEGDSAATIEKALEAVASCAYNDFGIKPYWIPRLIADVDICARKLGSGYRVPTVADFKTFTPAERTAIAASTAIALYNGLVIYLRAEDGSIVLGDLGSGAIRKLTDTTAYYMGDAYHYEGGASLRCIRR